MASVCTDGVTTFSWPRVFVSYCGIEWDATGKITDPEKKGVGSFVVFPASNAAYVIERVELIGADWWLYVV